MSYALHKTDDSLGESHDVSVLKKEKSDKNGNFLHLLVIAS